MKLFVSIFLFALFFTHQITSQNIKINATVYDELKQPASNILVYLLDKEKNVIAYQYTNNKGEVSFSIEKLSTPLFLKTSSLFFEEQEKEISLKAATIFYLVPKTENLDEVIINAKKINNDTLSLGINKYQVKKNDNIEKTLKKIPGITVDKEGRIKYFNKEIEKILIDGDDLADKQYTFISKNLRSEVLDDIQVLKNFEENTVFKRTRKSKKIALNLKIKDQFKNVWFGNTSLGYGNGLGEDEKQLTNNTGLLRKKIKFLNAFKASSLGEKAIPTLFGNNNQVNQPIYSVRKNNIQLPDEVTNFNDAIGNTFLMNKKVNNLVLRSTNFIGIDKLYQESTNATDFFFQNESFLEANEINDKNMLFFGDLELKYQGKRNSYFVNKLNYKVKNIDFSSFTLFNSNTIFDVNSAREVAFFDNLQYTYQFKNGIVLNNEFNFGISNMKEEANINSDNLNSLFENSSGAITQNVDKELKYFDLKTDFSYLLTRDLKTNVFFNLKGSKEKYNIGLTPENEEYSNNTQFSRNEFIFRPKLIYRLTKKAKLKGNFSTSFFRLNNNKEVLFNYYASLELDYWGNLDITYFKKQNIPENQNFLENFYLTNNNAFRRGRVIFNPLDYTQFKVKLNNKNSNSTVNNEFAFEYKKSNSSLLNNFSLVNNINFNNTFLIKREGEEYSFKNQLIFLIGSYGLKLETKQTFLSIPINNENLELSKLYDGLYNAELSTYFSSGLNFNLAYEYNRNVQSFNENESSFYLQNLVLDIDWAINKEINFIVNGGLYTIDNNNYKILNLSLDYEPEDKKFSYSLKLNNLVNENEFSIQYRDTFFSSVTTIPLVPFYGFLSVKYVY